ncbi:hypothetical protein ACE6H2_007065 [Prunus campanulata]
MLRGNVLRLGVPKVGLGLGCQRQKDAEGDIKLECCKAMCLGTGVPNVSLGKGVPKVSIGEGVPKVKECQ